MKILALKKASGKVFVCLLLEDKTTCTYVQVFNRELGVVSKEELYRFYINEEEISHLPENKELLQKIRKFYADYHIAESKISPDAESKNELLSKFLIPISSDLNDITTNVVVGYKIVNKRDEYAYHIHSIEEYNAIKFFFGYVPIFVYKLGEKVL